MWASLPDTLGLRASERTRQDQLWGPRVPGELIRASDPRPSRSWRGATASRQGEAQAPHTAPQPKPSSPRSRR